MSPMTMPALSAGPPGCTSRTIAAVCSFRCNVSRRTAGKLTGCKPTPRYPRGMCPFLRSVSVILFMAEAGTAIAPTRAKRGVAKPTAAPCASMTAPPMAVGCSPTSSRMYGASDAPVQVRRSGATRLTTPRAATGPLARVRPTTSARLPGFSAATRSEEHTSELQSRRDLVCRLLLEKKNQDQHRLEQHRDHQLLVF